MKLADFTTDPTGIDAAILRRRVFIISASSLCAIFGFFACAWALTAAKKGDFVWLSAAAFVGFLPALYAWTTGWVSRWKAIVFGLFLPVGIWSLLCFATWLVVEGLRFVHS